MGKIHQDLKRAEKEYTARKRQQATAEIRKPSPPKNKIYLLILTVFMTTILGLNYFRSIIADYPTNRTEIPGKFPRNIVTGNVPVNEPSRTANLEKVSGMQQPELQKEVPQHVKVSSLPEPEPRLIPQISINLGRKKDPKKEALISRPTAETNFTEAPPKGADHPVVATKSDQNEPAYQSQNTQKPSDSKATPLPDAKSEFLKEQSMAPVLSARTKVTDKEEPPDPGKLIDWLLKKRAMQNE